MEIEELYRVVNQYQGKGKWANEYSKPYGLCPAMSMRMMCVEPSGLVDGSDET
jgi:hypothetical protein